MDLHFRSNHIAIAHCQDAEREEGGFAHPCKLYSCKPKKQDKGLIGTRIFSKQTQWSYENIGWPTDSGKHPKTMLSLEMLVIPVSIRMTITSITKLRINQNLESTKGMTSPRHKSLLC